MMKEYIFEEIGEKCVQELILLMQFVEILYIVVETDFIQNHIEKVPRSNRDRGTVKWIAETKNAAFESMDDDEDARKCHIDNADCFPRFYYHPESFLNELAAFLSVRNQEIRKILVPLEFSPFFDVEQWLAMKKYQQWKTLDAGNA